MNLKSIFAGLFQKSLDYSVRTTNFLTDFTFNNQNYFDIYEISSRVNRAIGKRSQKVGQTKFILTKNGEIVEDNPYLTLLDKPNDHQTGKMFWALASEYRDVAGFAVIRKMTTNPDAVFRENKEVKSLELLNSYKTQINYVGNKIESFTETKLDGTVEVIPFTECIYWIRPDPKEQTRGVSLLKAGLYALDTDNQLIKYQNAIIKNGGTTDMIMSFKEAPNTSTIDKMRASYIKERRDPKNADIPYFLGGEAKAERLGMTPAELAYLESRKLLAQELDVVTGVPSSVLGVSQGSTFDNADQDYKNFIRETIKPIVDDLVNMLDWMFIPEEYDLSYEDPSPEDVDTKIKKVNALYAVDASTINERREIMGLDRVEDPKADEILVSYSKQPLGYEEPTMKEELPVEEEPEEETKTKSVKHIHHLLRDKSFRDMYRKEAIKKADKSESIFLDMIQEYFADQEGRILADLNNTKLAVSSVFDEEAEIKIVANKALPLLRKILEESGRDAIELLDNPEKFQTTTQIKRWLTKRANLFSKEITATTYEKLKTQFSESLANGESRDLLIRRIESVYEGFDENRAKTIARTEVHGATQKGNFEGSKQAGSEIKIWVAVMDDVTRDSHASLDGEEVPIDKKFSNGLMYAGDPSGDGSETINCRCQTI